MKFTAFLLLVLTLISCHRDVARTSDFMIFQDIIGNRRSKHLDTLDNKHVFAVGLKWTDANFEGRHYQLPRSCDSKDLLNFFNQRALVKDSEYVIDNSAQQEDYESIKNRKKEINSRSMLENAKDAPKVLQYSFLYFIDDYRVIFVSDNQVKYKNYNPVIKFEHMNIDLQGLMKNKVIERGYYTYDDGELVVELRQFKNTPSKKLFFELKNEDIILKRLVLYKLKRDNHSKNIRQIPDLEIDLKKNLPDIIHLPVCFKIDKQPSLFFKTKIVDSTKYVFTTQWVRRYFNQDAGIDELLDQKLCDTW
ncbi:MAG: hypothetical protein U0T81_17125 [Saprospiraceae bacterium]